MKHTILKREGQASELFARLGSNAFFNCWVPKVFGSINPHVLKQRVIQLQESSRSFWGPPLSGPNLVLMNNAKNLDTRP